MDKQETLGRKPGKTEEQWTPEQDCECGKGPKSDMPGVGSLGLNDRIDYQGRELAGCVFICEGIQKRPETRWLSNINLLDITVKVSAVFTQKAVTEALTHPFHLTPGGY